MHANMVRPGFQHLLFGLVYFATAAAPIALTRLDGGVAFFWIATALLTAKLRTTDRREWVWWLSAAGAGSILATGLLGLGWAIAPAMMALNLFDALIAERVLTGVEARRGPISAERAGSAIVAACLAGAIITMIPAAAVTTHAAGTPMDSNVINWVIGHALGGLTFGPFMHLCMRGQMRPWILHMAAGRDVHSLVAVLLLMAACAVAFNRPNLSLLFLPVLALTALTYRAGLPGAAFGSVVLGFIGAGFTLFGDFRTAFGSAEVTFQFFQFFLGITTLTMLPVSAVISARKDMTERLQKSEAGYRLLANNIDDVVVSVDLLGLLSYVSPSIRKYAAQEPSDVIGSSALDQIDPAFHSRVQKAYGQMIAARGDPVTFEFVGITTAEQKRWFEMQGRCVLDHAGEPSGVIGTIRETTARKMLERALTSAAESDPLTGLLNRRAFFNAARVTVDSGASCCLAVFDLDYLDAINTVIGNEAGDLVLTTFANVAGRTVRGGDLLGRLGGDEFALLLPNTPLERAEKVCRRLLAAFAGERIAYLGRPIVVSTSAGLTLLEGDLEEAMRTSHSALARAKEDGRASLGFAA